MHHATLPIDIVYEDEHLVVVNKPSGLLCVPGLKEPDNLFDRVKAHFANARVVHRLDMATSGLVIFALNHAAQKSLGQMFERKIINKEYSAILAGELLQDQGEIIAPLICDWENRHPILGDKLYNHEGSENKAERLLLHARTLTFKHPISDKEIALQTPSEF